MNELKIDSNKLWSFQEIKDDFISFTGLDFPENQNSFVSALLFSDSPVFKQVCSKTSDEKLLHLFSEYSLWFGLPEAVFEIKKKWGVFSLSILDLEENQHAIHKLKPSLIFETDDREEVVSYANFKDDRKPFLLYDRELGRLIYVCH